MIKALKIILLLILVAAVAMAGAYVAYKDKLLETARVRLESELSGMVRLPVNIGSVKYIPFQSVSMERVTITAPDKTGTTIADITKVTVTIDVLSSIRNKQLETTIVIDGLRVKDISCNATLRTESRAAATYKKVFDPSLIKSVFIMETEIAMNRIMLQDISGILKIDRMSVSKGEIALTYNDAEYLLTFAVLPERNHVYEITARSDYLNLSSILVKDNGSFTIEEFTGVFYTLRFDLNGGINEPLSPEMTCSLKGTVETDLETLASLPVKAGSFIHSYSMSGSVRSDFDLNIKGYDLGKLDLDAVFDSDNLRIGNVRVNKIEGKLAVRNGRINAPLISASLYNGTFNCDLIIDLKEEGLPYVSSMAVENVDFGLLMSDATENKITVRGTLDTDTSLRGYARIPATSEGYGNITITDADLGPMPLLTPLLGNIYYVIQKIVPETEKVRIHHAQADFDIKNRQIMTENLTLWGENISINAKGYMDFDGNLDFTVQNQFEHPDPEKGETWQAALSDAIIQFGKVISKAHLRGTIKKPKWEFEYLSPIKDLFGKKIRDFLDVFR